MILPQSFFNRNTPDVARDLLGKFLVVRQADGQFLSLQITETEAYHGFDDDACHGHKRKTERCAVMYGEAGFCYVYFTYGMHYMLNIVTMKKDFPAAVLVRSLSFDEFEDEDNLSSKNTITLNRFGLAWNQLNVYQVKNLLNGPAKITQALKITRQTHNGLKLSKQNGIYIEDRGVKIAKSKIKKSPRIGINYAQNSKLWEWRFYL